VALTDPAPSLTLDRAVIVDLQARLPEVATHTIGAIMDEVPAYAGPFGGPMGKTIAQAVEVALAGFLKLASTGRMGRGGSPLTPALEGAYLLGKGEARQGRSADALLAAYRVGARVAWRELSAALVSHGVHAGTVAAFAELVFAYIDELSAASVAGHADQVESTGRRRQRALDLLALALLRGDGADMLAAAAERADWSPPRTLTAVLLPEAQVRPALTVSPPTTLVVGEAPDLVDSGTAVLLLPDVAGLARPRLLRELAGRHAVVGPVAPWLEARRSYRRALRAVSLGGGPEVVDTDAHLATLVLTADPEALADLRQHALAPLARLRPAAREKLEATLRSWLLHHGRREDVAADLFVHPQTVRYRMGQLRELYGERLDDPATVLELTVALAVAPA
jgi:PucR C-terminal helix-turn-helix domain